MRVILTKDVPNVGHTGDELTVADGFGRNYLIPRGVAQLLTKDNHHHFEALRKRAEREKQNHTKAAEENKGKLDGQTVEMTANAQEDGKLYGSVGSADLAEVIQTQFGLELTRKQIRLPTPIKEVGTHKVEIQLFGDISARLTIIISPTNGSAEQ